MMLYTLIIVVFVIFGAAYVAVLGLYLALSIPLSKHTFQMLYLAISHESVCPPNLHEYCYQASNTNI